MPITETLAARIDGVYMKRDGFLEDVISGRDLNDRNRYMVRGQLLYQPSDDLSVRVIGDYAKRNEECCGAPFLPAHDTVNTGGVDQLPAIDHRDHRTGARRGDQRRSVRARDLDHAGPHL